MDSPREVLKREVNRLRKFAYSLTGNKPDADDLVHDLAVKVLEKGLPDYDDPVPWLITLCKNLWIDQLRYREVRARPQDYDPHTEGKAMTPGAEIHLLHTERVLRGLKRLPEHHRLALSLVAIEGMSYAETAKILEIPIGTVMSRVARAREILLEQFSEHTEKVKA